MMSLVEILKTLPKNVKELARPSHGLQNLSTNIQSLKTKYNFPRNNNIGDITYSETRQLLSKGNIHNPEDVLKQILNLKIDSWVRSHFWFAVLLGLSKAELITEIEITKKELSTSQKIVTATFWDEAVIKPFNVFVSKSLDFFTDSEISTLRELLITPPDKKATPTSASVPTSNSELLDTHSPSPANAISTNNENQPFHPDPRRIDGVKTSKPNQVITLSELTTFPYIVTGPRDTGKTAILIESAKGLSNISDPSNQKLVVYVTGRWLSAIQLSSSPEAQSISSMTVLTYGELIKKMSPRTKRLMVTPNILDRREIRETIRTWFKTSVKAILFDQTELAQDYFRRLIDLIPGTMPWAASYTCFSGEENIACNMLASAYEAKIVRISSETNALPRKPDCIQYDDDHEVLFQNISKWIKNNKSKPGVKAFSQSWPLIIVLRSDLEHKASPTREIAKRACQLMKMHPFVYGENDESAIIDKVPSVAIIPSDQSYGLQANKILHIQRSAITQNTNTQTRFPVSNNAIHTRLSADPSKKQQVKLTEAILRKIPESTLMNCYFIYRGERCLPVSIDFIGTYRQWRIEIKRGPAYLALPPDELLLDLDGSPQELVKILGRSPDSRTD